MELTVLGCSGSYGAPAGGACSGYLIRAGDANIWVDCGSGSFANLQRHINPADLSAVVISHAHADHCVDILGLHVMYKYGLEMNNLPVFAPEEVERKLEPVVGEWTDTFAWKFVADGDEVDVLDTHIRFARTDHPLPTVAMDIEQGGKRLVYTSDTGPQWSVEDFRSGADLVLSEATYTHDDIRVAIHLSARQAGEAARAAQARKLMLTHLWPMVDPVASAEEGSEAFGSAVTLAAPHLVTRI